MSKSQGKKHVSERVIDQIGQKKCLRLKTLQIKDRGHM